MLAAERDGPWRMSRTRKIAFVSLLHQSDEAVHIARNAITQLEAAVRD